MGVAVRESECEENGGSGTKPVPGWQKLARLDMTYQRAPATITEMDGAAKNLILRFFAPRCTKLGGIDQQQQQRKFSIANFVALDPPFSKLVVESQIWSKTGGTGLGASHLS